MMVGREVLLRVDKPPATPGGDPARGRGPARVRRPRAGEGAGDLVPRARAGDRRHRRCRRQRPDRADRRAHRSAPPCGGHDRGRRQGATRDGSSPRDMLDAGVGHIPEDRQRRGLVLEFSIAENIALHDYCYRPDSRLGWLYPRRLVARAAQLIEDFDVRGGGPQTRAGALSGGNQQKVVVAREVAPQPEGADRRPADARPRRRRDRVRPPPPRRRARRGPRRRCSSRSSSTRSCRSPTGSSSSSRAGSSASTRRTSPRRSSASR